MNNRRSLRFSLIALAMTVGWLTVYSQTVPQQNLGRPTGTLTPLGGFVDLAALDSLYQQFGVPLVVISDVVFLPSVPCAEPRKLGAETERRDIGGEKEDRELGGENEDRRLGGDTEKRGLSGTTEERQLGGESEERELTGGTEERAIGGEKEDREVGGASEQRDLAGRTEKRDWGGAIEDRQLGGDTEGRDFGGDTMVLLCTPTTGGFQILDPPRTRIQVYDGHGLKEVLNGLVMY